jgi:uncharacterized protein (DUF1499 family)
MRAPAQPGREGRWRERPTSWMASAGFLLAVLAALAALSAGPGYRFGYWSLSVAFTLIRWSVVGGIAASALALVGMVRARLGGPRLGFWRALFGLAISLPVVVIPLYYLMYVAPRVPPIHDITTDTENPPVFEAILPLRAEAPNPPEHPGARVAAQQRAAYPDVAPLTTPMEPELAFRHALATAREMGWQVVANDPGEGGIEAVDQTPWFGFNDDIVIRVRPQGDGSRIDVRSKSRIGVSDLGTNAERVRHYLRTLQSRTRAELAPPPE